MSEKTTCIVVGGGPAGMVAALLLARGGVEVTVLEKHADFLRDFRGDTVHPSTLRLLDELGLFEQFDALPHTKLEGWGVDLPDGRKAPVIDFTRLRLPHRYIAMVPQWDLLDLLAEAGRQEPTFTLRMSHDVTGLLYESGRVVGVRYDSPDGPGELRADLTIACDGRWSLCRREGGLVPREYSVDADLWWFRLPPADGVGDTLLPRFKDGLFLGVIPRQGYLQTGYFLHKGADAQLRARGIEALRRDIVTAIPELSEAVNGHVPGRRGRHQPRRPGRGGCGEAARRTAARSPRHRKGLGCCPAPPRVPHGGHPDVATLSARDDGAGDRFRQDAGSQQADARAGPLSAAVRDPRLPDGGRRQA
jgi:2-polyprenyl-6-methoxyphenol hydroxylase-like FAD-dependent oxidoreductase